MGANIGKVPVPEAQTEMAASLLPLIARSLLLVLEGTAKPIEAPDDEDIPFPEEIQCILEALALVLCPADRIGEDFDTAGRFERVEL
jgi:hypothetical protein